jgi:hypothetical protein
MARTGPLYAAAISPGTWAPASHASLFTGLAPAQHGVSKAEPELPPGFTTLPQVLRARDYRTFGISSSYWLSAATGFDARPYERTLWGLRTATDKYVRDSTGAEQLYCLVPDPGETTDRARVERQQTATLRQRLDDWEGTSAPALSPTDGMTTASRQQQELLSPHPG